MEAASVSVHSDGECEAWLSLSGRGLARAYGKDDEEYPLDAIKEANPEYEGRSPATTAPAPDASETAS